MKKRISAAEVKAEMLATDPAFKAAYEALEGEFQAERRAVLARVEARRREREGRPGGRGEGSRRSEE